MKRSAYVGKGCTVDENLMGVILRIYLADWDGRAGEALRNMQAGNFEGVIPRQRYDNLTDAELFSLIEDSVIDMQRTYDRMTHVAQQRLQPLLNTNMDEFTKPTKNSDTWRAHTQTVEQIGAGLEELKRLFGNE